MIHKLLHTADFHLNRTNHSKILSDGKNSKLTDTLKSLDQIDSIIEQQNVEILVFAGDAFQIPKPSPDYTSILIDLFWKWEKKVELLIAISGNHDSSPSARYNALNPLESAFCNVEHFHFISDKEIEIIDYKGIHFVCFPHTNDIRIKSAESIEKALLKTKNSIVPEKTNILISHFPIDEAVHILDESQLITSDLSFSKIKPTFEKFDLVLLGDIHKYQKIGKNAFYSGSIIQNTFNEEGEKKGVCLFEIDTTDKSYEHSFIEVKSRLYRTIRLKNIEEKNLYNPTDYSDTILRVKLEVTDIEKMLNYDVQLQTYFSKSFIVLPDFSFVNRQGKIIAEITGSDLITALSEWISEVYKEKESDEDFEFLVAESVDMLKKRIELNKIKESNDT